MDKQISNFFTSLFPKSIDHLKHSEMFNIKSQSKSIQTNKVSILKVKRIHIKQ